MTSPSGLLPVALMFHHRNHREIKSHSCHTCTQHSQQVAWLWWDKKAESSLIWECPVRTWFHKYDLNRWHLRTLPVIILQWWDYKTLSQLSISNENWDKVHLSEADYQYRHAFWSRLNWTLLSNVYTDTVYTLTEEPASFDQLTLPT